MSEQDAPPAAEEAAPADTPTAGGYDESHARLAYGIIQTLLEHTRVVSDLVALMAQALDRDTTEALTNTPHWNAYLDSRRAMEKTRADIERFAQVWTNLAATPGEGGHTAAAAELSVSPKAEDSSPKVGDSGA